MELFLSSCFLILAFVRGAETEAIPVTCLSGQRCILPCQIQKGLSEIMWSKDSLAIQYFPRNSLHHEHGSYRNRTSLFEQKFSSGNCSLAINNTTLKDNGVFKCYTKNQSEEESVSYFKVQVNVPVEEVVIRRLGDSLICSSEGVHPKPECRWSDDFSNSSLTVDPDDQRLHSINCTTPLLSNVSQYTCTVSTPFNSKRVTYVQMPRITVSGTTALLPCAPSSSPVKNVNWTFNHSETILTQSTRGQVVSESWRPFVKNVSASGNLSLENLTLHQQGQFTCVTSTDTETYTAITCLEIIEPLSWYVPIVIAVVLVALTVLTALPTYKRKETDSEVPASDSKPNSSQRIHAERLIWGLLGLGSTFPCQLFEISSLYLNRHMDQIWIFSFIALVSQLPTLISVVVNSYFVVKFSPQKLTLGCLVLVVVIFVIMLVSIMVPISEKMFFCINMPSLWLVALFRCLITHNLSARVDSLPEILRNVFYVGQSFAGTVASIVMIISVAIADADAATMQVCCYLFAIVVSLVTLVAYCIYQCHFNQKHQPKEEVGPEQFPLNDLNDNNNQEPSQGLDGESTNATGGNFCTFYYVALVPLLTSSVYPAVTANVQTMSLGTWERFFILVCSFLVFNIFSLIGQKMFSIFGAYFLKHFLIIFPVLLVFHTGFMICVLLVPHIHRQFNNVVFPIIMALFSLSHVFLSQLSLSYKKDREKDAGPGPAIYKTIWRDIGGTVGVALSFAFRALVQFIAPN